MRDYKKESDWQKKKYDIIKASIDKELGNELREKLKEDNMTISDFIKRCINDYLKCSN